jgi:uncharacterized membrane protein YtjA (UPF0391 family)
MEGSMPAGQLLPWNAVTLAIALTTGVIAFGRIDGIDGTIAYVAQLLFYVAVALLAGVALSYFLRRQSGPRV